MKKKPKEFYVVCAVTGKKLKVNPTPDGEPRTPRGWKHRDGKKYSPEGWKSLFVLRAITLPVAGPQGGPEEWPALREAIRGSMGPGHRPLKLGDERTLAPRRGAPPRDAEIGRAPAPRCQASLSLSRSAQAIPRHPNKHRRLRPQCRGRQIPQAALRSRLAPFHQPAKSSLSDSLPNP